MAASKNITVAYAKPEEQVEIDVSVASHANVAIAIRSSGVLQLFSELKLESLSVGIHGKRAALDTPLSPGDRVEIYRPLEIDPMEARRQRARRKKSG